MQVQLITPEKIFFQGDAQMVTVPGTEGEFGVLDGHAPFVSTIRPGVIAIDTQNGEKKKIVVLGGLAEVVPERCTILAEAAEDITPLTASDAQARLEQAKQAIEEAVTSDEKIAAERRLAFAQAIESAF